MLVFNHMAKVELRKKNVGIIRYNFILLIQCGELEVLVNYFSKLL